VPAPQPKSLRFALTLNLLLPGAGQLYLGQTVLGGVLGLGFLACFGTMLAIFLRGYAHYVEVSASGEVFEGNNLETLVDWFHTPWLIGLLVAALAIYIAALVGLAVARPSR